MNCCLEFISSSSSLVLIALLLISMNGQYAYRIIEWSPMDSEDSGSGEDVDEVPTKSKTNFYIWNGIETEPTKTPEHDSLKELSEMNPGIKFMTAIPTTDSNKSKQQLQSKSCLSNQECTKDQTCNLYSRKCERCRYGNEICRRDENCCNGKQCLWGRCRQSKKDGTSGSLCTTNKDCSAGLCCAKEHGLSICKNYLEEGNTCDVPAGGLVFSIHHSCPCMQGLRCKVKTMTSGLTELEGTCVK